MSNKKSRNYSFKPLVSDAKAFDIGTMYHYTKTADAVSAPTVRRTATRHGIVFYEYDAMNKKVRARGENSGKWSKWMNTTITTTGRVFSYHGNPVRIPV